MNEFSDKFQELNLTNCNQIKLLFFQNKITKERELKENRNRDETEMEPLRKV